VCARARACACVCVHECVCARVCACVRACVSSRTPTNSLQSGLCTIKQGIKSVSAGNVGGLGQMPREWAPHSMRAYSVGRQFSSGAHTYTQAQELTSLQLSALTAQGQMLLRGTHRASTGTQAVAEHLVGNDIQLLLVLPLRSIVRASCSVRHHIQFTAIQWIASALCILASLPRAPF